MCQELEIGQWARWTSSLPSVAVPLWVGTSHKYVNCETVSSSAITRPGGRGALGSLLGKTEKMLPDLRQIGKERHPCQGLGKEAFRIFELQKGVQCGWGVVSEADGVKRRGGGADVTRDCQPRLELGFCSCSSESCGSIYASITLGAVKTQPYQGLEWRQGEQSELFIQ